MFQKAQTTFGVHLLKCLRLNTRFGHPDRAHLNASGEDKPKG